MSPHKSIVLFALGLITLLPLGCGDDDDAASPPSPAPVKLFWAEKPADCSITTIRRLILDGSAPEDVISLPGPDSVADFAVDKSGGKIYFSFSQSGGNSTETVRRVNLDGTGLETIASYSGSNILTPGGIALDIAAGRVYWLANGGCSPCPGCGPCSVLMGADLNGANPHSILTLTGTANPSMLAMDTTNKILFWSDIQYSPHVQSINIAGSALAIVYVKPLGSSMGVGDLEIVESTGKIYWLENEPIGDPAIMRRANLDGTASENILTAGGGQSITPRGLAVDQVGGKIYWTESNNCNDPVSGRIRRANLDGTDVETVLDGLGVLVAIEAVR